MVKPTDPCQSEGNLLRLILSSNANTRLAEAFREAVLKAAQS